VSLELALDARGLDLAWDDGQQALCDAVAQLCRERCDDERVRALSGSLPREPWRALAELGVLGIGTPEGEGGALELVAALEALGRAVFPGPLVATFLATRLLPEPERRRVVSGESLVCVATPPELPWGCDAGVFVEIDAGAERAWLSRPAGPIEPVATLGGEPWGRGALVRGPALAGLATALAWSDVARAAYLAAAGRRLVEDAAEHARTRKQFGRAIGEFQAVAHPLADAAIALDGAAVLARAAAWRLDANGDPEPAAAWAAAARFSATRAALGAVHVAHQVFGAVGITVEGPAFHVSRRIRQVASLPPSERRARPAILATFTPDLREDRP
jgi:alkylation response protein AidB-like acyl-CoA dehydrogenase